MRVCVCVYVCVHFKFIVFLNITIYQSTIFFNDKSMIKFKQ